MYTYHPHQHTPRFKTYHVKSPQGALTCITGQENAASKIADYLNDHQIYTLADWKKQPQKVRLDFVCATASAEPNFEVTP